MVLLLQLPKLRLCMWVKIIKPSHLFNQKIMNIITVMIEKIFYQIAQARPKNMYLNKIGITQLINNYI